MNPPYFMADVIVQHDRPSRQQSEGVNQQPSFLQSSEWEGFQKNLHHAAWRVGGVLVVRHRMSRSGLNYLYSARPKLPEKVDALLNEIEKIAGAEKSLFLRIDRADRAGAVSSHDILAMHGRLGRALQPQQTSILDLSKSEDQLLGAMREKTRYNIRLSRKKGVEVKNILRRRAEEDFEIFWGLLQTTAQRNSFRTHARTHYEMLLETRSSHFSNELFFAQYQGGVIAAAMINFYQPTSGVPGVATYLHGASSGAARNVMASYALHWHIAREAKMRGYGWYDLWGTDEKKWPGLTRFKWGFGGNEIVYAPTVEVVYRPVLDGLCRLVRWFR